VLAHEHDCYSLRNFSKDAVFRVCMMPYACIGEGGLLKLSESTRYEYEGKHALPIACDITVGGCVVSSAGELAGAAASTSYLISPETSAGPSASYPAPFVHSALRPQPPPPLPHAPSKPLCAHKAVIRSCRSSARAQGLPSTLLWQRSTTADS
jgi:hypothetical protein